MSLWSLVNATRIQAIAAVVSAAISIPAAFLAIVQARGANEDATRAERQLGEATAQRKAAEQAASESKRLADSADASLREVRAIATAAQGQREELARAVSTAEAQLASFRSENFEMRRARVRGEGTELHPPQVGNKLFAMGQFRNNGREDPVDLRYWSSVTFVERPSFRRAKAPGCEDLPARQDMIFSAGKFWWEGSPWTTEQSTEFLAGRKFVHIQSRLCYKDSSGSSHSVDVCGVHFASGGSQQC